jgi:uncharacterized SAM-binding protein YcdF (DUF218 family)
VVNLPPRGLAGPSAEGGDRMGFERRTLHDLPPEIDEDEESVDEPAAPGWFAVTRGAAFFVGAVTLLVLYSEMRFPHFTAATWWLDLSPVPKPAARGALALLAVLLLLFSFFPKAAPALRKLAALCTVAVLGVTLWHTWKFYQHVSGSHAGGELPVPFALHAAGCLIVILPGLLAAGWERSNFFKDFLVGIATISTCVAAFPLAQFVCLGKVDDRCAADAVVVFADGGDGDKNPAALADQVRAACDLYRDGKAHKVILAGRGESPEAAQSKLRQLATSERIPDKDVVLSTAAKEMEGSVAATAKIVEEQKLSKVLVTGQYYQLPRIKLCCQHAGFDVHTVPIRDKARLQELRPAFVREATALWMSYLHPLLM